MEYEHEIRQLVYFNSRPRVGGVCSFARYALFRHYFNSRPRVGGVHHETNRHRHLHISILAPAWGASVRVHELVYAGLISILAPAWGASQISFAPSQNLKISILAPAWGASKTLLHAVSLGLISILAPAWGASVTPSTLTLGKEVFQFSPPRGGRRLAGLVHLALRLISILAPAWGASRCAG